MQEARFWKYTGDMVECQLCNHFCKIREGTRGLCQVRKNVDGQLFSLNYGKLIAAHVDPIEKKPLFHFLPGSQSYSIAATGCNFRCSWCQNWDISQLSDRNDPDRLPYTSPDQVVKKALNSGCSSISYTYTEPTIYYEFARDVSVLAKDAGLKNVWVSNGYMSEKMLEEYLPLLDAINVDIKAFDEKVHKKFTGAHLQPVLENCKTLKKAGVWLEVTTLVIPGINDSQEQIDGLAGFIVTELGQETPWHISRYYPQPQFREIPATTPDTIVKALKTGKQAGLQFVYAGNLGKEEDTHCPNCGELLIARNSVWMMENKIVGGECPKCKTKITGIWE